MQDTHNTMTPSRETFALSQTMIPRIYSKWDEPLYPAVVHKATDVAESCSPVDPSLWSVVYLYGPPGRGKSVVAARWLKHWALTGKGRSAKWISEKSYATLKFDDYRNHTNDAAYYDQADYLVIDDLGSSHNKHIAQHLVDMLRDRYEHCRPTCITSNLMPEVAMAHLCQSMNKEVLDSTLSRLQSAIRNGGLVDFTGLPDYRVEDANG